MKPTVQTCIATVSIAVAVLSACGSDHGVAPVTGVDAPQAVRSRTYVYEREFDASPGFAARPTQVAVLDLEPSTGGDLVANVLRYRLPEGTHRFCIDATKPALRRLV